MIQKQLPSTMQRISIGGVLFGFKLGVTFIGVKTYKTKKNIKPISFVISRPVSDLDLKAMRLLVKEEIARRLAVTLTDETAKGNTNV